MAVEAVAEEHDALRFNMRAVARHTGLKPELIRAWERRYGAVRPARSAGGQRVYNLDDLRRLELLKTAVDAGHAISKVARLPRQALEGLVGGAAAAELVGPAPREGYLEAALAAVRELERRRLQALLHQVLARQPLVEALEQVVLPLMGRVGACWEEGSLGVAQEHLASAVVREVLAEARAEPPADAPLAVLATPSGQRHELGTLAASLVLPQSGWQGLYLGPDLPVDQVLEAVERVGARALALGVGYRPEAPAQMAELAEQGRELARRLPAQVALLVGGRAAAGLAEAAGQRAVVMPDLYGLASWLAAAD